MGKVHDVAAYVAELAAPMSTMKLQKLVYYSQAWHAVWEDRPLFEEPIEAWAGGPVVRKLYNAHRGKYRVTSWPHGDSSRLTSGERESIEIVVDTYGTLTGQQLSFLTHRERPWRDARSGQTPGERGDTEIPLESMVDYYCSVDGDSDSISISEVAEIVPGHDL